MVWYRNKSKELQTEASELAEALREEAAHLEELLSGKVHKVQNDMSQWMMKQAQQETRQTVLETQFVHMAKMLDEIKTEGRTLHEKVDTLAVLIRNGPK